MKLIKSSLFQWLTEDKYGRMLIWQEMETQQGTETIIIKMEESDLILELFQVELDEGKTDCEWLLSRSRRSQKIDHVPLIQLKNISTALDSHIKWQLTRQIWCHTWELWSSHLLLNICFRLGIIQNIVVKKFNLLKITWKIKFKWISKTWIFRNNTFFLNWGYMEAS